MAGSQQVDSGAGLLRQLFTGASDAEPSSTRSVVKAVAGSRPTQTTKAAGSSEVVGRAAGMLQQLVMSDNPTDVELLRSIAAKMPPERFNALLTRSFRDPKSPADSPTLNHIGQEILKVANGEPPSLTKSSAELGDTGVGSVDIDSATDLPEKSAPHKPKIEGKIVTPSDDPKFHVKEGYKTNADGTTEVLTPKFNEETGKLEKGAGGSASLDKQTAAAAVKAAKGGTPNLISDAVVQRTSKPQQQSYNENLTRLLGLISPQGVKDKPISTLSKSGDRVVDRAVDGGVPSSAIKGSGPVQRRSANSIGKTTAGDYETISQLLGDLGIPVSLDGTTAQELATKIIAGADQSMFNATPLTAGQRQDMMGAAKMLSGDPKTSEPALRAFYPDAAAGGTMKGRQGSVQQASIDTLTRKIEELLSTGSTDIGGVSSAPSIELNASSLGGPRKATSGEVPNPDLGPKINESQTVSGPAEAGDELPVIRQLDDTGRLITHEKPEPVGERRVDKSRFGYQDADGPDEFSKTGLRTSKAQQLGGMEGREITTRRPVDIQNDLESATDPRVIAQLREELKDSLAVTDMLPKEFQMAATHEGPAPPAPFKQGETPDTPEDAAFQFLYDNNIGTHEQRVKLLQQGNIVNTVAKIRNKIHADAVAAQGTTPTINVGSGVQGTAPKPANPKPAAQAQSADMKSAAALGQVPNSNVAKQTTEGANVRTLMESLRKGWENTKGTKEFIQKHGRTGVGKAIEYGIPTALIGGGLGAIYSGAQYLFGGDDAKKSVTNNRPKRRPFGR